MQKNKTEIKYFILTALIISLPTLVFFILATFVIQIINGSIGWQILTLYGFALILAFIITAGWAIFNPALSDAMLTLRRLLRFESLSNPLLLRLSIQAPGTYHHSLNVSNLSQRASKSIGANSLLVRTAAYYHDIGKLEQPMNFIENQAENEIPQSESTEKIRGSAQIIIAHVKNGIKIAKENNLPDEIIDLIAEHHGTTKAWYFYKKAVEKGLKIKKTDFRYPGPKPQSKESAVLMIADCAEATARAEQNLTKESISQIVNNAISERLEENQFKNSDLTENDLIKIKNSMISTLLSIYHQRMRYSQNYD